MKPANIRQRFRKVARPRNAVILIAVVLVGTEGPAGAPAQQARPLAPAATPIPKASGLSAKVKFKDATGKELFSIKPEPDGAKLVGPDGAELARYHRAGDSLKLKDPADNVLGYIVAAPGSYQVKDRHRKVLLATLRREDDGRWTLEDGRAKRLNTIRPKDVGVVIEDAGDALVGSVQVKNGKSTLRDAKGTLRFSTNNPIGPLSVACLGLDAVGTLPLRAGLLACIALTEGH